MQITNECGKYKLSGHVFGKTDVYQSFAHAHPYLSADARWAVFNATLTGRPQIYAASIPPQILEELEQP